MGFGDLVPRDRWLPSWREQRQMAEINQKWQLQERNNDGRNTTRARNIAQRATFGKQINDLAFSYACSSADQVDMQTEGRHQYLNVAGHMAVGRYYQEERK